jgi:putative endonuclease
MAIGIKGERIAVKQKRKSGYRIIECNWRFSRAEIDIIAEKNNWLIFCEVKTRSGVFHGTPDLSVGRHKQRMLIDAAIVYMDKKQFSGEFSFDIIAIVFKTDEEYSIRHFKDAFFPGLDGID